MKRKTRWLVIEEEDCTYFDELYPYTMMFRLRYMGGFDFFVIELGATI